MKMKFAIYLLLNLKTIKKIEQFVDTLINPHGLNHKDSFFYSILYTVRYWLMQKIEPCTNEDELRLMLLLKYLTRFVCLKKT